MFCKNARTKIAMASPEPEPTSLNSQFSKAQAAAPPAPEPSRLDPSHVLMDNTADPTLQMLLSQQMNACNQLNIQQRLAQIQLQNTNTTKPMAVGLHTNLNNNAAALNLLMGTQNASTNAVLGTWLQNEILAQKQQQERMLQLRQLTAVNLRQQSSKPRAKKNFRASAA